MQNKLSCSKACLCLDNNDLNMNKCNPNDPIDCECNNKKCHNYLLCENIESIELLDSHDGLCVYCYILNGKLKIVENISNQRCSFCLYVSKDAIKFPDHCEHHICIECYKRKFLFEIENNEKQKNNIFSVCSICLKF
jgi:hypothetical protein